MIKGQKVDGTIGGCSGWFVMSAIVYFKIHFYKAELEKKFYSCLFCWKVEKAPGTKYWMITIQERTHCEMINCSSLAAFTCASIFRIQERAQKTIQIH